MNVTLPGKRMQLGVIDELSAFTRVHYRLTLTLMSRKEPVKLIVDGKEYVGGVDWSHTIRQNCLRRVSG